MPSPLMFRKKYPSQVGFEALEALLIQKRVLKEGELAEKIEVELQKHYSKGELIPNPED